MSVGDALSEGITWSTDKTGIKVYKKIVITAMARIIITARRLLLLLVKRNT